MNAGFCRENLVIFGCLDLFFFFADDTFLYLEVQWKLLHKFWSIAAVTSLIPSCPTPFQFLCLNPTKGILLIPDFQCFLFIWKLLVFVILVYVCFLQRKHPSIPAQNILCRRLLSGFISRFTCSNLSVTHTCMARRGGGAHTLELHALHPAFLKDRSQTDSSGAVVQAPTGGCWCGFRTCSDAHQVRRVLAQRAETDPSFMLNQGVSVPLLPRRYLPPLLLSATSNNCLGARLAPVGSSRPSSQTVVTILWIWMEKHNLEKESWRP